MINRQILRFVILSLFVLDAGISSFATGSRDAITNFLNINHLDSRVINLNKSLRNFLTSGDTLNSRLVAEELALLANDKNLTDSVRAESYYLTGIYHLKFKSVTKAIRLLGLCTSIRDSSNGFEELQMRAYYNLSVAYASISESMMQEKYALKALECGSKAGKINPYLSALYFSLGLAYESMKEYDKAQTYLNLALNIELKKDHPDNNLLSNEYYGLGVCYSWLGDYSKAKIYYEKTRLLSIQSGNTKDENYINLLNGLATTYSTLNLMQESETCFKEGNSLAVHSNSTYAYNLINSYALYLAKIKKTDQGEEVLKNALERALLKNGTNDRISIEVLANYASYLREYKIDNQKSVTCYKSCLGYINDHNNDLLLRNTVLRGYSMSLRKAGLTSQALQVIQELIYPGNKSNRPDSCYENPDPDKLVADISTLRNLITKYDILWDINKKSEDNKALLAASNTGEIIISLLDKVRINISGEESRLLLGDKYRNLYLNAIRDFNTLYCITKDNRFLESAFRYSEKTKVAGLLTSARELKAAQLKIPESVGNFERELEREIILHNVKISDENQKPNPDQLKIEEWKENLLKYTRRRDSLILIFEKQYPDYYALKYNTRSASLSDVPNIVGRDGNYINYVVSDSLVYIFVVNRKYSRLIVEKADSSFLNNITQFRRLITMSAPSDNASLNFKLFQTTGYGLYETLVEPVRPFLISDKVIISPDNILSYIPFEVLPASMGSDSEIKYKNLNYLMKELDISYTYSATFKEESEIKGSSSSNKLIAFAPDYPEPIDIQTALMSRQGGMGVLHDLPFARQEARYVSDLMGGRLYENSDAKESVYKNESGKFDIIHLAMHTLLNEKDPLRSTLIFSHKNDSLDDGFLKTFEIYGIPLHAKMVVLSSCNTGAGHLNSGEGILSLARGFIFSGSQSVVMSMWEIEDKSGTDVVKMFYDNLRKGYSKSISMRRARTEFLKNADQLRAHPYYWAALVIYGDNEPIYKHTGLKPTLAILFSIVLLAGGFYLWRRRYS